MAKIKRKRFSRQGELFPFPSSLIAISEKLHNLIAAELEKKVGVGVKKITQNKIREIISAPEFKEVYFVKKKHCLDFSIVVLGVYFPASYECGVVLVSLQLPLHGDCGQMEEAMKRIAREVGLGEVSCSQNGIAMEVILSGENLPYQIIPNPFPSFNGKGRKVFVTKEELLLGDYSPIE